MGFGSDVSSSAIISNARARMSEYVDTIIGREAKQCISETTNLMKFATLSD